MPITTKFKQQLKGQAHALKPVVMIGHHGLTENVHAEIERALFDHELIKIRVPAAERAERQQLAADLCQHHQAELVQQIGRILVVYKKNKTN